MKRRTTHIAVGILFILALFVSVVPACICEHHESAKPVESTSCHGHGDEAKGETKGSEESIAPFAAPDGCYCVEAAPDAITKSEKVKPKSDIAGNSLPRFEAAYKLSAVRGSFVRGTQHILTLDHHNLPPGRAPPRL